MPIHGEFRMLEAHAQLAREAGVPANAIVLAENGTVVGLDADGARIVDKVDAGMTFVDGLGVGDIHDVALRDRRRLSEDGVLIVVATVGEDGDAPPPELIARGFGEGAEPLLDELREEAAEVFTELLADDITEIKLLQEHLHDALAQLVYDRTRPPPDDPPGGRGGMRLRHLPGWADVIEEHAAEPETARQLVGQLGACEASALAFCRLLERWARGDASPATPGRRAGVAAARRRPRRDGDRRPRAAARALPARARARARARGPLVVRRARAAPS